jgi:hypothetical protein
MNVPNWLRDHGLLVANLLLFVTFFIGMVGTGLGTYNEELQQHAGAPLSLGQYLTSGHFGEAVFENWESEFLQMASYVVLTAWLFQRGSAESKPLDEPAPQDADPANGSKDPKAPWPVRRGGIALAIYQYSLSIAFVILFLASFVLHAITGAQAYNEEQALHDESPISALAYAGTSQFWFESFQNWQSEFLAVAAIVYLSIYLRHRGSAESKPVAAAHQATGE